ncbi:MAG: CCA tRNA nucleotidyltransferase [Pseudomonadota bacterium]
MRLDAPWLNHAGTQAVMQALSREGHCAYFVGGCVRNTILGQPVSDIDIATNAPPEVATTLAEAAGLRVVPTGFDHGTITVLSDGPHEVTTFRRDVSTDGRRAVVAFSTAIEEDAARRDFTMNALYADRQGEVIDPLGGLPDALERRVRFIGTPAERIAEDALRILRFFRFMAIYGDPQLGPDPEGMAACAASVEMLHVLSRERVGSELRKLLGAPDPAPAVAAMASTGALAAVLPGTDIQALAPLVHLEGTSGIEPSWLRRLAVLGGGDWREPMRLSRAEMRVLQDIREGLSGEGLAAIAQSFGEGVATDVALIRAAAMAQPLPEQWRAEVSRGAEAEFPVSAQDLIARYGEGPKLGAALERLRTLWIESDFKLDHEGLLKIDSDS